MRFMSRMFMVLSFVAALFVMGCGEAAKPAPAPAKAVEAVSVAEMAKAAKVELVPFAEVNKIVGNGVYDKTRGTLIDARPAKVYAASHIPTAFLMSDTEIATYWPAFEKLGLAKTDYIVTYCGGVKCEKSLIVAKYLKEQGYTNVKMYLDGMPDWEKKNYGEITMDTAKKFFDKGGVIFIDARPAKIFAKSSIPGSINIPDTEWETAKVNLPADKEALYIPYCGGFKCEKSHFVAEQMVKLGYKKVQVYAGGVPEWQAAGYPLAPAGKVEAPAAAPAAPAAAPAATTGLPQGDEPGIVKTEFFLSTIADPAKKPANVTIVDVRNANELGDGVFPGSINISSKETAKGCDAFVPQLPKTGYVVFHCASGGRAMEVYDFLKDKCKLPDISRFYYLDAYVNCSGGKCTAK
ncbi:rhodanese-like domain-containing protein [Seleniivibrio woodruffii]|nr:rhodanese-like domain-containing protein [Seleniivibrio woodruffii]